MKLWLKGIAAIIAIFGCLSGAAAENADLIVHGRYVVTMDESGSVIENGAVAFADGLILAVGPRRDIMEKYHAEREIGGQGRAVLPGLINGHTHGAMTLFRGLADDLPLMTWLENYIFPMEGRFVDEEFVRLGASLACYEMIRGGTTTAVDMYFYPDIAAQVYATCGLRAFVAAPMIDFPSPGFEGWDDSFAAGIDFIKKWKNKHQRIYPVLGPHAPYTVSPGHLQQAAQAAAELDVPISIHVAEDKAEIATLQQRYQSRSVKHLNALGLLEREIIAAHMVYPDAGEISLLAKQGTGVIHNPTSNLKTAAGIAPVPDMLKAGVRVGLGTDGAASNNDLDMWEEIRLAALLHKGISGDAEVMPASTALSLATRRGAAAIGMGGVIGALAPGHRADIIQVDLTAPGAAPIYDVISHLVYVMDSDDVVTTIIDGAVVMQDGDVLTLDGASLRTGVQAKAAAIEAALSDGAR